MQNVLEVIPKKDLVFKALVEMNPELLGGFMKGALPYLPESEFEDIRLLNPQRIIRHFDEKAAVVDVRLTTKLCKLVTVEMQQFFKKYLKNRTIFNLCDMIISQVNKGNKDYLLEDTIVIVICDFVLEKELAHYQNSAGLYYESGLPFSDKLQIHILELPKLPKKSDGTLIWDYLHFFKSKTKEELNMMTTSTAPGIKKALTDLESLSADEEFREVLRIREMDIATRNTEKILARQEGLEEGRIEGRIEGEIQGKIQGTIETLFEIGASREEIQKKLVEKYGLAEIEAEHLIEGCSLIP